MGAPCFARLALAVAGLLILVAPLGGCGTPPTPAATPTFSLPTKLPPASPGQNCCNGKPPLRLSPTP